MPRSLVILDTQTYEVVESHFLNGGTTESAGMADYLRSGSGTYYQVTAPKYVVYCAVLLFCSYCCTFLIKMVQLHTSSIHMVFEFAASMPGPALSV
jgi:hypothetical protein